MPSEKDERIPKGKPANRGTAPVSPIKSPWWDRVRSELLKREDLVGTTLSIEELSEVIGQAMNSDREVRKMSVIRRLADILELVERGPNGSRSKGARYKIVRPAPPKVPQHELHDEEFLKAAIERMCGDEEED